MSNQETKKKTKKMKNIDDGPVDKVPRKKKKVVIDIELFDEHKEDDMAIDLEADEQIIIKDEGNVSDTWTREDYVELIKRMEIQIPKGDTLSFSSRSERLDWEMIKFGNHSIDECYEKWKTLRTKVRHFRLLNEVLQDAKVWVEQPWSAPFNKKKARHPEQPPRPLSSFMLFYMDKKNKTIKRHPEMKLTDISKLIGEKFKALPQPKKAYYIEKAKAMQEEYRQKLIEFYEKYPELMKVSKKQAAQTNKPLPPFKVFLREKLQKHQKDENFNRHDFIEKYKEVWKSLSYKKKAYWIRLAKEEEDKYLEHLHEEEEEGGEDKKPTAAYRTIISKEERAILDRLAGKPEKPPNSAYSLFSRLMLQDKDKNLLDAEPKNRMKEVALRWKELPEEQKKIYAEKVQHMHEHYKLEMANYLDTLPEEKKAEELAKLQPKKKTSKVRQRSVKKALAPDAITLERGGELWKNEPEKPPLTAWDLFKTEFLKKNTSHSQMPNKMTFNQAAAQWKMLSRKEIEKYKKRHQELKDEYMVKFEKFLATLDEDELKEYSAWKKAKTAQAVNEESLEDESSSKEEDEEDYEGGNSSSNLSNSSDDSDSGVSEEDG